MSAPAPKRVRCDHAKRAETKRAKREADRKKTFEEQGCASLYAKGIRLPDLLERGAVEPPQRLVPITGLPHRLGRQPEMEEEQTDPKQTTLPWVRSKKEKMDVEADEREPPNPEDMESSDSEFLYPIIEQMAAMGTAAVSSPRSSTEAAPTLLSLGVRNAIIAPEKTEEKTVAKKQTLSLPSQEGQKSGKRSKSTRVACMKIEGWQRNKSNLQAREILLYQQMESCETQYESDKANNRCSKKSEAKYHEAMTTWKETLYFINHSNIEKELIDAASERDHCTT